MEIDSTAKPVIPNTAAPTADSPTARLQNSLEDDTCIQQLVARFKIFVKFPGLSSDDFDTSHVDALIRFLKEPLHPPIFATVQKTDGNKGQLLLSNLPSFDQPCLYFIRNSTPASSTVPLPKLINFGSISGNTFKSFLTLLDSVYSPILLESKKLPSGVSSDLKSTFHKFLAFYTDTVHQVSDGSIVLYVPKEDLQNLSNETIHRLESMLMNWTRQIKSGMMTSQFKDVDDSGLMDEVQYWQSKAKDLIGIQEQLDRPDVKQIIEVLKKAQSSHLEQFNKLATSIQEGARDAQENIRVLTVLVEPCSKLASGDLRSIHPTIMRLIVSIRAIAKTSKTYETSDKVTNLLRRLCRDIVFRCSTAISLDNIFAAQTSGCLDVLEDVSEVCKAWKAMLSSYQQHVVKNDPNWNIDLSAVFSQTEAFIQRCSDLNELLEGQTQFSRLRDGKKAPDPFFPVSSALKIKKMFEEVDAVFLNLVDGIASVRAIILDVTKSEWHTVFGNFRRAIKDLENRLQNATSLAWDEATTLEKKVEVFKILVTIAHREGLVRTVEKRAVELAKNIQEEIGSIKSIYEQYRLTPEILRIHPDFAGSAYWVQGLVNEESAVYAQFQLVQSHIPETFVSRINEAHDGINSSLQSLMNQIHDDWVNESDEPLLPQLGRSLLIKRAGRLHVNFPQEISVALVESALWNNMKMDVPVNVQDVVAKKEDLRVMRMSATQIVQGYNGIIDSIPNELLSLFCVKISVIDRKISPGLTTLTWMTKGSIDAYVKDCLRAVQDLRHTLDTFYGYCNTVDRKVREIARTSLCLIESKKIYTVDEFSSFQVSYRQVIKEQLVSKHSEIAAALKQMYQLVQNEKESFSFWLRFVEKVDLVVEEALRVAVKNSLQSISKAINGEGSKKRENLEMHPIFKVEVVLDNQRVEFNPPLQKLEEQVNKIARDMISSISVIQRLLDTYSDSKQSGQSRPFIYDTLVREEEILKIFSVIQTGMSTNTSKCQAYTRTWDTYREIWEINKDVFIRRYGKLKPSTSTFDADIGRYSEVSNNAQKEETFTNVSFVRLDCSPLKHTIASHCSSWQEKLLSLLASNAATDLRALYDQIKNLSTVLNIIPTDLDMLSELASNISAQRSTIPEIQAKFDPIREQYQVLAKYDVQPKEDEQTLLDGIETLFASFMETLAEAEKSLEEYKSKFRNDLIGSIAEFASAAAIVKEEVTTKCPFKFTTDFAGVNRVTERFKETATKLLEREKILQKGLTLFRIDQAPSKDLEWIQKTLELLTTLWAIVEEWQTQWTSLKRLSLPAINAEQVRDVFTKFQKKLFRFQKDTKEWNVFDTVFKQNEKICKFSQLLPDLQNPRLKQRHWAEISTMVGKNCNPFDTEFTLERMVDYGMEEHKDKIAALSQTASNEI